MRHWHAAYTRPSAECSVNDSLRLRGIDTLFLHELAAVHHARQVTLTRRPLFSRYVVAAVDYDDDLAEISGTVGVLHILSTTAGSPVKIGDDKIEELRALGDADGRLPTSIATVADLLMPGTKVRVRAGPIDPFVAFVLLDRGPQVRVRMRMFKRWVRGTFDRSSIEILSPERTPISNAPP